MRVTDLADPVEVARRRRYATAGVLYRLEEHGCDGVRTLEQDRLLDPVRRPAAEGLPVVAQMVRRAVPVGVGHLEPAGHERLEGLLGAGDAGDRQRALRRSVIRDRARDHLVLGRLSDELPVLLGKFPRGLDGLAAAGGEKDPVEVARRIRRKTFREVDSSRVRVRPEREVRELLGLPRRHLGELTSAVADLDHEQPGQPVEVATAGVIPDAHAVAADDHRYVVALVQTGMAREMHPQVVARGVDPAGPAWGPASLVGDADGCR